MEGFRIAKNGAFVEKIHQYSNQLFLLDRNDDVEIMLQTVYKGRLFYIYPGNSEQVLEFIYILQGEVECELNGQKTVLGPNDYCSFKMIKNPVYFTALTDVTYLWITTEPSFRKIGDDYENLMDIVKKVEEKDRYTFRHSERVASYSVQIAKKLMLPGDQLENLYLSCELHDVGKINIPIEILNKPGKLTDEEFDLIKKHPGDGADMIRNSTYNYLASVIEQHHERLDGSGYPFGLKGNEIDFNARIIAVSDTFDAMTEDRSYRKAFTPEYAMNELKRLSGSKYEPAVVEALESILKEEGKLQP